MCIMQYKMFSTHSEWLPKIPEGFDRRFTSDGKSETNHDDAMHEIDKYLTDISLHECVPVNKQQFKKKCDEDIVTTMRSDMKKAEQISQQLVSMIDDFNETIVDIFVHQAYHCDEQSVGNGLSDSSRVYLHASDGDQSRKREIRQEIIKNLEDHSSSAAGFIVWLTSLPDIDSFSTVYENCILPNGKLIPAKSKFRKGSESGCEDLAIACNKVLSIIGKSSNDDANGLFTVVPNIDADFSREYFYNTQNVGKRFLRREVEFLEDNNDKDHIIAKMHIASQREKVCL